tara:strand:+ start:458 stop:676 length:219 start_codon:yes stop_codon:yes gene_type:complete
MAKKKIVNCETGEETIVDLTAEEEAALEAGREAQLAADTEAEAAKEKRVADKASGDAKLKALGLTDDEIAAR